MTTSETMLPPRPDQGPAEVTIAPPPKKSRFWPIVGAIAGGFIVLGAIGSLVDKQDEATVIPPVESSPALTLQEAGAQGAPLLDQATAELDQIIDTSPLSQDIIHLNNIANLYDQAAALFEDVLPAEALYLHSAADHVRNAADLWAYSTMDQAGAEIDAATDDLNRANDVLPV